MLKNQIKRKEKLNEIEKNFSVKTIFTPVESNGVGGCDGKETSINKYS